MFIANILIILQTARFKTFLDDVFFIRYHPVAYKVIRNYKGGPFSRHPLQFPIGTISKVKKIVLGLRYKGRSFI